MELTKSQSSYRVLVAALFATLIIITCLIVGVRGLPVLTTSMAGAWFLLGMAGTTVCFITYAQKKDPDEVIIKLFLTICFFVLSIGWLLK